MASNKRSVGARLKELASTGYLNEYDQEVVFRSFRFVCGRPAPCPGLIGYTTDDPTKRPDPLLLLAVWSANSVDHPEERTFGFDGWFLEHPKGYRWDADTQLYYVMSSSRRPAKRAPDVFRQEGMEYVDRRTRHLIDDARTTVGQFPRLPTIVVCPECGFPNDVPAPDDLDS